MKRPSRDLKRDTPSSLFKKSANYFPNNPRARTNPEVMSLISDSSKDKQFYKLVSLHFDGTLDPYLASDVEIFFRHAKALKVGKIFNIWKVWITELCLTKVAYQLQERFFQKKFSNFADASRPQQNTKFCNRMLTSEKFQKKKFKINF